MTCERASWPGLRALAKPGVVAEGRGADLEDRFGSVLPASVKNFAGVVA